MNGLGITVDRVLRFLALRGIISRDPAIEASPFLNALGSLSRSKLEEGDGIDVHGIGVMSRSRGVERREDPFFL